MNKIKEWLIDYMVTMLKIILIVVAFVVALCILLFILFCSIWTILNLFDCAREMPGWFEILANSIVVIMLLAAVEFIRRNVEIEWMK